MLGRANHSLMFMTVIRHIALLMHMLQDVHSFLFLVLYHATAEVFQISENEQKMSTTMCRGNKISRQFSKKNLLRLKGKSYKIAGK